MSLACRCITLQFVSELSELCDCLNGVGLAGCACRLTAGGIGAWLTGAPAGHGFQQYV